MISISRIKKSKKRKNKLRSKKKIKKYPVTQQ